MSTNQVIGLLAAVMRAQRSGDEEEAARLRDELGGLFRASMLCSQDAKEATS